MASEQREGTLTVTLTRVTKELTHQRETVEADLKNLAQQLKQLEDAVKKLKGEQTAAEAENKKLKTQLEKKEDLNEKGLSKECQTLRKENVTHRKTFETKEKDVGKVRVEKDTAVSLHEELVNKYDDMVRKYDKLLSKLAEEKNKGARAAQETEGEQRAENGRNAVLQRNRDEGNFQIRTLKFALD